MQLTRYQPAPAPTTIAEVWAMVAIKNGLTPLEKASIRNYLPSGKDLIATSIRQQVQALCKQYNIQNSNAETTPNTAGHQTTGHGHSGD